MCIAEALEAPVLIVENLGIERQIVQTSEALFSPHLFIFGHHFVQRLEHGAAATVVVGQLGSED